MTHDRAIERLLDAWMADDSDRVPDRVIEGTADRIARARQLPAWRLQPWRFNLVSTPIKLAAVGAALLAVLVGGAVFIGGGASPTTSTTARPTAIPAPTPAPASSSPAPASPAAMARGELQPGTYVTQPHSGNSVTWQVTVPAGWVNGGNWFLYPTSVDGPAATNDAGEPDGVAAVFLNEPEVILDGCDYLGGMTDTASVDELVAAIQAKDDWVVSTPTDVSINGFAGTQLDVELPADLSRCGGDNYVVFGEPGTQNGFHAQGPSQLLRVWLLDVDDRVVSLMRASFAASPGDALDEAQQIIESSVVTP
ncbi:MAG TPA: hypothetical protein VFY23_13330 [Candidatus Limnocylindrales bacterium]|nr:hypothetical protein [Candidatus Limnocylindrales bacterium]